MENYIVSARKYRPSTFESVVGQKSLTTTLKNAIASQKLAHAYLFCGPRGVGKTTCARIFAKTINCLNLTNEGEACNECESCLAFNEQRSYNIHELDAASNNSVDDIRLLIEQVRIPPQIGRYKVYIIDEVHMLSTAAFNAFLKTLEEPPKHAIFILATTEKHKLLPTILSRCQIYDFSRISVQDTVEHLTYVAQKEGINAEPDALNVIAQKADGGMRDALSIFDQVVSFTAGNVQYQSVIENLNVLDYEYYFRLTDRLIENKVADSLLIFNDILNKGFEGGHFITGLSSHFRDLLVSRDEQTLQLLEVGASIRERYKEQAAKCTPKFLYKAMKLANECDLNYRVSKNKRFLVELTLIQIAQITSEPEDESHGRGPKQAIKPIFNQSDNGQPQQETTIQATDKSQTASNLQPARNIAQTATISVGHKSPIPQKKEEKKIPVMKAGSLGVSIKNPYRNVQDEQPKVAEQNPTLNRAIEEDYNINDRDLNHYWQEFANALPIEQRGIMMRMKNSPAKLISDTAFEMVVDNEIVAKDMTAMIPEIQNYLRRQLHNSKITMNVRVSEPQEIVRAYGRVERFQMMAQKNPELLKLKETFGLELN